MTRRDKRRSSHQRSREAPAPLVERRDPNLIPAITGDACPSKLQFGEYVAEACEHEAFKACCLSCAVQLPSIDVLEEHLQTGSRHVVARVCSIHGAEAWR